MLQLLNLLVVFVLRNLDIFSTTTGAMTSENASVCSATIESTVDTQSGGIWKNLHTSSVEHDVAQNGEVCTIDAFSNQICPGSSNLTS